MKIAHLKLPPYLLVDEKLKYLQLCSFDVIFECVVGMATNYDEYYWKCKFVIY